MCPSGTLCRSPRAIRSACISIGVGTYHEFVPEHTPYRAFLHVNPSMSLLPIVSPPCQVASWGDNLGSVALGSSGCVADEIKVPVYHQRLPLSTSHVDSCNSLHLGGGGGGNGELPAGSALVSSNSSTAVSPTSSIVPPPPSWQYSRSSASARMSLDEVQQPHSIDPLFYSGIRPPSHSAAAQLPPSCHPAATSIIAAAAAALTSSPPPSASSSMGGAAVNGLSSRLATIASVGSLRGSSGSSCEANAVTRAVAASGGAAQRSVGSSVGSGLGSLKHGDTADGHVANSSSSISEGDVGEHHHYHGSVATAAAAVGAAANGGRGEGDSILTGEPSELREADLIALARAECHPGGPGGLPGDFWGALLP